MGIYRWYATVANSYSSYAQWHQITPQGHDEVKACGAILSFPLTVANDHLCFNNHAMVRCVFM